MRVFGYLFSMPKVSRSRRDLLRGRLGKLLPAKPLTPLVMRYPHPSENVSPSPGGRRIRGINVAPVAPTDLTGPCALPSIPVFRPPGAIDEPAFLAGCTRCGDCAEACPHDAIVSMPDQRGRAPTIDADQAACLMCEGFPCITSCDPGVLTDAIPPMMGTARITPHLCLAHHHTTCTVCSERCPVDGAISVDDGKPIVNETACTGCGVCRHVCPAPENAILLMPTLSRPGMPRV